MAFFTELEQIILKFVWKHKRSQMAKTVLRKKTRTGSILLPDLGLYYKATLIKAVWYQHENRHIDYQINGTEQRAQKLTHAYTVNQSKTKETRICNATKASSINDIGKNWTATCKRIKLAYSLMLRTKINSKTPRRKHGQ